MNFDLDVFTDLGDFDIFEETNKILDFNEEQLDDEVVGEEQIEVEHELSELE